MKESETVLRKSIDTTEKLFAQKRNLLRQELKIAQEKGRLQTQITRALQRTNLLAQKLFVRGSFSDMFLDLRNRILVSCIMRNMVDFRTKVPFRVEEVPLGELIKACDHRFVIEERREAGQSRDDYDRRLCVVCGLLEDRPDLLRGDSDFFYEDTAECRLWVQTCQERVVARVSKRKFKMFDIARPLEIVKSEFLELLK